MLLSAPLPHPKWPVALHRYQQYLGLSATDEAAGCSWHTMQPTLVNTVAQACAHCSPGWCILLPLLVHTIAHAGHTVAQAGAYCSPGWCILLPILVHTITQAGNTVAQAGAHCSPCRCTLLPRLVHTVARCAPAFKTEASEHLICIAAAVVASTRVNRSPAHGNRSIRMNLQVTS
jgi:aerobic-type carbon monoxide dehydrogenase small subunit (CoxS/CutS family)